MQRALGPAAVPAYRPLMDTETRALLGRLAATPGAWREHVTRYGGSLTLRVMYGYAPAPQDDEFLGLAGECVDLLSNKIASTASVWPVDLFPACESRARPGAPHRSDPPEVKALPEWAPGAGFKRSASQWKARMEHFVNAPFAWTRTQIAAGTAVPSFVSTLLDAAAGKLSAEAEHDLKWTANSMYSASLDTTATAVAALLLALLNHPDVLARAQAELDAVVGPDRLPGFADRAALPYVDAVLAETLRHAPPVPLGLPHRLSEDDTYNGARIPKGSLVFGNAWYMSRDPAAYPNPEAFDPTRFLGDAPAPDPRAYVFGFGRRRCPGAHLVEDSLWLLAAALMHAFSVAPERDDEGGEVGREVEYTNPVFHMPSAFPVVLRVRPGREALVADEP
jgi:cytochrome P450